MEFALNNTPTAGLATASVSDHGNTVDVGGIRTSPEVAAMLGFKEPQGNDWSRLEAAESRYSVSGHSDTTPQTNDAQEAPTGHQASANEPHPLQNTFASSDMASCAHSFPEAFNALTEFHITDGASQEYGRAAVETLARETGLSQQEARDRLEAAVLHTQTQLDSLYGELVSSAPEAAREAFIRNNKTAIRNAYQELVKHGTTTQADRLAEQFRQQYVIKSR